MQEAIFGICVNALSKAVAVEDRKHLKVSFYFGKTESVEVRKN